MSAEHADAPPPADNHAGGEPQVTAEPGIKVFAGNLTFTTDDAGLRALFAPVEQDIISTVVIQRFGRSAGYGFVTVKTQEAANKAVQELDKKEVDGRAMIVEVARNNEAKDAAKKERREKRQAGRRGPKPIPGEVTDAEANGQALVPAARIDDAHPTGEAQDGTGETPKPKKKKSKKRKPKALAENGAAPNGVDGTAEKLDQLAITDGAQADVAKPKQPRRREPREPREPGEVREPRTPRTARPRREPGEAPAGEPSKSVLFIANLAFSVDETVLTDFFTEAGVVVKSARVVRRRWGTPRKSKGYGFVDVGDEAEQHKAIELANGKMLADREISVKIAVDAKHIDEAADKAEETENPEHPTNGATTALTVVPVAEG